MVCPLCKQTEVNFDNKDMYSLDCPVHGTSEITKEAIHHFVNFDQRKQKKITDYLSSNTVKVITIGTLDSILRTA